MAPRTGQTNVRLNVYDLSDSNQYTSMFGLGFYHTGVEIGGDEFSFASGAGVYSSTPRDAPGARFRESIDMGTFAGSSSEARALAYSLRPEFGGDSYNILTRNCNSFSDALCQLLVRQPIPAYINRAAYLGSFFSCLVPNESTNQAPVGATNTLSYAPFAGSGMSLSDKSTSSKSSDLTDRREKMRLAALRRMNNESTHE